MRMQHSTVMYTKLLMVQKVDGHCFESNAKLQLGHRIFLTVRRLGD